MLRGSRVGQRTRKWADKARIQAAGHRCGFGWLGSALVLPVSGLPHDTLRANLSPRQITRGRAARSATTSSWLLPDRVSTAPSRLRGDNCSGCCSRRPSSRPEHCWCFCRVVLTGSVVAALASAALALAICRAPTTTTRSVLSLGSALLALLERPSRLAYGRVPLVSCRCAISVRQRYVSSGQRGGHDRCTRW